jgi:hypothetical protein
MLCNHQRSTSAYAALGAVQVRRQLEAAHKASAESRAKAARLAGELAARGAEVEQLTSLSLRGDATLQDYMASLKVGRAPQPTAAALPNTFFSALTQ